MKITTNQSMKLLALLCSTFALLFISVGYMYESEIKFFTLLSAAIVNLMLFAYYCSRLQKKMKSPY
jgi:hypothetical protein